MIVIVRRSVLHVVALLVLLSLNPASADDCIKRIFNRYCLGGAANNLPADVEITRTSSGIDNHIFEQSGKLIQIAVKDDRVISVTRREPPGSWLNFTDWKTKLVRLYGRAEDLSDFPAYATSRSSKLNAINANKGYAQVRWPQGEWIVSIIWDHRDYVSLRYELSSQSTPANDEGL